MTGRAVAPEVKTEEKQGSGGFQRVLNFIERVGNKVPHPAIALMLPFFVVLTIVWTLFFAVWYLLGIPFGIGT
jgi:aminobenzoyl-glutamate transport protein